jgi:hypothetical protein
MLREPRREEYTIWTATPEAVHCANVRHQTTTNPWLAQSTGPVCNLHVASTARANPDPVIELALTRPSEPSGER